MAKRLRPLTDACPKCLLKIGERTLLQRTVDAMIAAGINELVVVTGYRGEMIRDFLTEKYLSPLTSHPSPLEIHFIHNADYEHNNNIFSLWMTRPYTEGKDFLLSDKVIVDSENRILELSKVCSIEKAIGESVGFEKMTASYSTALFKELEQMIEREGLIDVFYERAFERLIPQGHTFRIVDTTQFFSIELDTPEDFENAKQLIPAELY